MSERAKKGLLAVAAVLLSLALLEGAGRLAIRYLEARRPSGIFAEELLSHEEPVLGFGLKRNLDHSMGTWRVRTNALAFREVEDLAPQKPPGEVRLFVVGGSTVFGWGVDQDGTISHRLQGLVDEHLETVAPDEVGRVRVVNAGVPWHASWHEAANIFFRILPLDPDWIIVVDGLNDTSNAVLPRWAPIHMGYVDDPTRIAAQRRARSPEERSLVRDVLRLSPSFRYFSAAWQERTLLQKGLPHPEVWDQYVAYKDWLNRLLGSLGVRFVVFFQPVMLVDKPVHPVEVQRNDPRLQDPDFARAFRELYLEGERRVREQRAFPVTSLRDVFRETRRPIYLDGLHYSAQGNARIAREIFEREVEPNLASVIEGARAR